MLVVNSDSFWKKKLTLKQFKLKPSLRFHQFLIHLLCLRNLNLSLNTMSSQTLKRTNEVTMEMETEIQMHNGYTAS
jgi:hypothetical protein